MRSTDRDEFRFRDAEADEFGIPRPLPPIARDTASDAVGRRISVIRHGSGDPVIMYLHGAGLNAHTWDATAAAVREPALAIDLPGHGDSDWHDDVDYRPDTLAAALAPVLRPQAATRLIVGHSLGGLTAALLTAAQPGVGLLLVDITPDVGADESAPVREFLSGPDSFPSRDAIVDAARAAGIGVSRAAVARGVALNTRLRPDGRVVFSHHLGQLDSRLPVLTGDRESLWAAVERTRAPVCLVRARRGFVNDDLARRFAERLPRARVIELDTGHNVQEDDPAALAQAITEFLSLLDDRATAADADGA